MDWLNLGIQLGILIVAGALAWGALKTRIALIGQRLDIIEGNHLKHIEKDVSDLQKDVMDIKLTLVRIEEHLKQSSL